MSLTEEQWQLVSIILIVASIAGPIWALKWFFTGGKKK